MPGFPCQVEAEAGTSFCKYCGDFCQVQANTDENRVKRVRTLIEDAWNAGQVDISVSEVMFALDGPSAFTSRKEQEDAKT